MDKLAKVKAILAAMPCECWFTDERDSCAFQLLDTSNLPDGWRLEEKCKRCEALEVLNG